MHGGGASHKGGFGENEEDCCTLGHTVLLLLWVLAMDQFTSLTIAFYCLALALVVLLALWVMLWLAQRFTIREVARVETLVRNEVSMLKAIDDRNAQRITDIEMDGTGVNLKRLERMFLKIMEED